MKTSTKKQRPGPKVKPMGFNNILLGAYWPAYQQALADWMKETGRDPGEHFTVYELGRANEILRAISKPQETPSNTGLMKSLSLEPDLVAFVIRRFIRLSETGDALGSLDKIEAANVFRLIAVANPELQPVEILELAKLSKWQHLKTVKYAAENHVTKALKRGLVIEKNQARLELIRQSVEATNEALRVEAQALPAKQKRRLATYRRLLAETWAKYLHSKDLEKLQHKGRVLRDRYAEVAHLA